MSYWEGTEYGENLHKLAKEMGKPPQEVAKLLEPPEFDEKDIPTHPEIPPEDMRNIWMKSCVWNEQILPHYLKGAIIGYLIAKGKKA